MFSGGQKGGMVGCRVVVCRGKSGEFGGGQKGVMVRCRVEVRQGKVGMCTVGWAVFDFLF